MGKHNKSQIGLAHYLPSSAYDNLSCYSASVKENADIFADVLVPNFNSSIEKSNIPSILKNTSIIPVFKIGDRKSEDNYRSVNILSSVSKMHAFFVNYQVLRINLIKDQLIKENHLVCF